MPGHIARNCKVDLDVRNMSYDEMRAHFQEKDFHEDSEGQ
jgi:hypothetical protein